MLVTFCIIFTMDKDIIGYTSCVMSPVHYAMKHVLFTCKAKRSWMSSGMSSSDPGWYNNDTRCHKFNKPSWSHQLLSGFLHSWGGINGHVPIMEVQAHTVCHLPSNIKKWDDHVHQFSDGDDSTSSFSFTKECMIVGHWHGSWIMGGVLSQNKIGTVWDKFYHLKAVRGVLNYVLLCLDWWLGYTDVGFSWEACEAAVHRIMLCDESY